MFKLTYLVAFLAVTSLLSCEKKTTTPATNHSNPNYTDTNSGKIFTIAGNGTAGFSGDGGLATTAELYDPTGVVVDASGNIYISDCQNNRIRKVTKGGIISTIAGIGAYGYSGDGGAATAAELYFPYGVVVDGLGNVYIADYNNMRIRRINPGGIISTIAGNGYGAHAMGGYSGDGGAATAAELSLPSGLALDGSGNLYIADGGNMRIRKVNTEGIISTIAGSGSGGYSGDGGSATAAGINDPSGVALDGSGNMYIADYGNNRIRKVNTTGIISTIAGTGYGAPLGGGYSGDGGAATSAELFNPSDVVVDGSSNIYISDADNDRIRMINSGGVISTIAGNGAGGYSGDGGPATAAEIGFSFGIALDVSGNIYIADLYNNRIRIVYK